MRRALLATLLAFLPTLVASAVAAGRIAGTVTTADGLPLAGATVVIEGAGLSTKTDAEGKYAFDGLRSGLSLTVVALRGDLAPEKATARVIEGATTVVDFTLRIATVTENVTVEAELPLLSATDRVSGVALSPDQVAVLPSLGEKDIFRALQLLPGVSGTREATSGLYVRGGTPSQNLISYDGFTVYHVDHLFGYFSAFNMDAVDQIRLSKSAFDPKDGGRVSGVLDLQGKSGRRDRPGASVGVSLLSVHGLAEVPLGKKASVLLAGRRSFQGPLYNKLLDMVGNQGQPGAPAGGAPAMPRIPSGGFGGRFALFETQPSSYFYDVNGKLLFEPSAKDKLFVSVYRGSDNVDNSRSLTIPDQLRERMIERGFEAPASFDITDTREWTNLGVGAQWLRSWGRGIKTRLSAGYSTFEDLNDRASAAGGGGAGNVEDNTLEDLTARFELSAPLGSRNLLEVGGALTGNDIAYHFETSSDARSRPGFVGPGPGARPQVGGLLNRDQKANQLVGWIQDRFTPSKRLTLAPGVRVTRYDGTGSTYVEPRVSGLVAVSDRVRLKAAWGIQHQFANRIMREDVAQGNREFWTLADGESVPVARARQAAAGFSYETRDLLVDIELFHKSLEGLTEFSPQFGPPTGGGNMDLGRFFYQGEGTARGLEALVQKKFGRNTGWLAYTLSQVEYLFPGLQEQPFPAPQDQTHELKLVDSLRFGHWAFSGTWIFGTGLPYTEPIGVESTTIGEDFVIDRLILGERNQSRLPAYHRMDLAASFDLTLGPVKGTLGVTVFNVYNRRNVWYKEFQVTGGEILENDTLLMGRTINAYVTLGF
jgi:ferric enterobactin receptor